MGRIEECTAEHEKSLLLARQSHSAEAEANALSGLADAAYMAGHMATAFKYFSRCAEVANQNGFGGIEVVNYSMAGFSRLYLNELSQALEDGLKTTTSAHKLGYQRAEMLGEILTVSALFEMGEYDKAHMHNIRAIELAQQLGAPRFEAQALLYEGKLKHVVGNIEEAIKILKQADEMSKYIGHGFTGARIKGVLAHCFDTEEAKYKALDEGMQLLQAGSVSHNHFLFYPQAIDVMLDIGDWAGAVYYATQLEEFTKTEPLPWSNFFIDRGRTLASFGQNKSSLELKGKIKCLWQEAETNNFHNAQVGLTQALNRV